MTPCIEHPHQMKSGYGQIQKRIGGKKVHVYAHRHAWEQVHGPIPEGMVVMHLCDNPPCVRLDHLRPGTPGDNTRDMHSKKRGVVPQARRGEASPACRYSDAVVEMVRDRLARGDTQTSIAADLGMAQSHVSRIKRGESRS